jgi:hypothetical protein
MDKFTAPCLHPLGVEFGLRRKNMAKIIDMPSLNYHSLLTGTALAVLAGAEVIVLAAAGLYIYTFNKLLPPQNSSGLPRQSMLQLESGTGVELAGSELPQ